MIIRPFETPESLAGVSWPRLQHAKLREIGTSGSRPAREALVRLWITEGCPYAFESRPAIWEQIRTWLAYHLQVCPKDITIVGSARTGFSLAPKTWGRPFGEISDLDIAVVSPVLFGKVVEAYNLWSSEYESGTVSPRNPIEKKHWDGNLAFGVRNIPLGFFDSKKLPTLDRYPIAQRIANAMWLMKSKLEQTPGIPRTQGVSARIYRDWASLVARISFNLKLL